MKFRSHFGRAGDTLVVGARCRRSSIKPGATPQVHIFKLLSRYRRKSSEA